MTKPPDTLLRQLAASVPADAGAEMALPSYLHRNPLMRWMAYRRLNALASWARQYAAPEAVALDFGCGSGILFPELSPLYETVYGVDPVLDAARLLREYYKLENIRLLPPAAVDTEILDHSVDTLICGEVFEHIEDLSAVLVRLKRKLKPSGHMLVSVPTENTLYRLGRCAAGFKGGYHVSDAKTVHHCVLTAGFRTVRRVTLPLPGPFSIYWVSDYILAKALDKDV